MAGISRPNPIVNNLKQEAQYEVLGVLGSQGSGGTIASCGLFDGTQVDEWNTSRVMYWYNSSNYLEIDILSDNVNIWRCGTTAWTASKSPLQILKWEGSAYIDVTANYPQTLTTINQYQWEKTISNLPKGKYKFGGAGVRLDSEWYIEDINSQPIFKICDSVDVVKNFGDIVPCRYTALTSGQFGYFSELGTTVAPQIPVTSSATPDGSFNWVYVGKDYLGRKKFIADRNIQHSISCDALNSAGITSEIIIDFDLVPQMSADSSNGCIASCSSVYNDFYAFQAFNKKVDMYCWATQIIPSWLSLEFSAPNIVNGYSLTGQIGSQGRSPKAWTFEGWNGTSWVILDTQTNITNWADYQYKTFVFNNANSYQKYRINVTANNGDSFLCIGELKMFYTENMTYSTRLSTGGISASDTDNEWDKIIASSTLGDKITAGDNNLWNWSNIYSWVSTSLDSQHRAMRGASSASYNRTLLDAYSVTSYAGPTIGFRPVLLVEQLLFDKYLIKKDSNYYSIDSKYYDESTHEFTPLILAGGANPNGSDIDTFGFNSLVPFITSMTKGADTFKPCDKLNNCEIKYYVKE